MLSRWRCSRGEVAIDQVGRTVLAHVGASGDLVGLAPPHSSKAQVTFHGAAGHPDPLTVLPIDLVDAENPQMR